MDACEYYTTVPQLYAQKILSLFSFGKYLELLLYSPTLCSLSPRLCDHTTPPPHPWSPENSPPSSRFNIIRVFELGKCEIKFRTSLAPAMFDLRIPPLQILRGRLSESALSKVAKFGKRKSTSSKKSSSDSDEDKKALRKEIKRYWQGVSDHLDKLVKTVYASLDALADSVSGRTLLGGRNFQKGSSSFTIGL